MELEEIQRRYDVVAARPEHARAMAPIMRAADKDEVWAAAGVAPLAGLEISLAASAWAWTWRVDGLPVCMFGICQGSIMRNEGIPWLLCSELMAKCWRPFLRHYRPFLDQMRSEFPVLANWVDARDAAAIAWLARMGFTISPAAPHGPFDMLHHRFEMRRETAL